MTLTKQKSMGKNINVM